MIRGQTVAWLGAIAALLVLGWWATRPAVTEPPGTTRIVLWTAGADPDSTVSSSSLHATLPGATTAPAAALRVNDAAELRRRLPRLTHLAIRGDGVDATDAAALRNLAVAWQRPDRPALTPVFAAVSAPLQVSVGQRVTVQGLVAGIGPAGARMTLQSPDGTLESVELTRLAAASGTPFSMSSSPTRAPGEFEWRLRLDPGGESVRLGVSVKPPLSPRVLILQASPHPELGRLQRWLTTAQAPVTMRTRISADRFRFAAAPGALAEFNTVDQAVMKQFDLLATTEAALAELTPAEEQAVATAVRDEGLGLLVVGGVDPRTASSRLLPWQLGELTTVESDDRRLMRLQGADGTEIAEWIALAASEITTPPLALRLVRDSQGRALAAAVRDGGGWLARSVLLDTWRWEQAGHGEAYSTFWAGMLSALARPIALNEGRWSLQTPDYPRWGYEPTDLTWSGPEGKVPTEAQVSFGEPGQRLTLPVAKDADASGTGYARYWPASPGWHKVQSGAAGTALTFFVQASDALPGLRAERRRIATAALVAASENIAADGAHPHSRADPSFPSAPWYPRIGYIAFVAFLASMALIWFRERG